MKRTQAEKDSRIKAKRPLWRGIILTFSVLVVLSAGQYLILAEYVDLKMIPIDFALGMSGYWALVSIAFIFIIAKQIKNNYDKPMRKLGEAATQVAGGDFSVYIEPVHPIEKTDYIDIMYEDFNKMVEELGSIETMKTDFISNVSHEIKTPISVIQNYTMALRNENLTPELRREYTDTIFTASQKLSALVANILKLSKLENQRIKPVVEPFDLCRQLTDCALAHENIWEERNINFEVDIEDKAVINADERLLEIVWNNLLSNALKFTEAGGTVALRQTSDEDSVTVEVSDTGCGMSEATIKRIFDKFYQGDTSHSQEGNGLGLALALKVIELVGGQISAKSELGVGTTFTVKLKTE
ncbi:MAG: HAMP domain-containing histidine kinase [Christensenellaceae bacterium]|jgi:signal transduction histidine kinase|nr:HAMP domain-containing histidine kinase [Christensenellaceae bacterium]